MHASTHAEVELVLSVQITLMTAGLNVHSSVNTMAAPAT